MTNKHSVFRYYLHFCYLEIHSNLDPNVSENGKYFQKKDTRHE